MSLLTRLFLLGTLSGSHPRRRTAAALSAPFLSTFAAAFSFQRTLASSFGLSILEKVNRRFVRWWLRSPNAARLSSFVLLAARRA